MKAISLQLTTVICILLYLGCGSNTIIPKPSPRELIRKVFSHDSTIWFSALKPGPNLDFYLKLTGNKQDSLHVLKSIYWINADTAKINKTRMIKITIDSVSDKNYVLKFIHTYYPALTEQLRGEYKFKYENNTWTLKDIKVGSFEGNGRFPE